MYSMGNWDECLRISEYNVKGQYCLVNATFDPLKSEPNPDLDQLKEKASVWDALKKVIKFFEFTRTSYTSLWFQITTISFANDSNIYWLDILRGAVSVFWKTAEIFDAIGPTYDRTFPPNEMIILKYSNKSSNTRTKYQIFVT